MLVYHTDHRLRQGREEFKNTTLTLNQTNPYIEMTDVKWHFCDTTPTIVSETDTSGRRYFQERIFYYW